MTERQRALQETLGISSEEAARLETRALAGERVARPRQARVVLLVSTIVGLLTVWGVALLAADTLPRSERSGVPFLTPPPPTGCRGIGEIAGFKVVAGSCPSGFPSHPVGPPVTDRPGLRKLLIEAAESGVEAPATMSEGVDVSSIPRARRAGLVIVSVLGWREDRALIAVPTPGPDAEGLWWRERDDRIDDLLDRLERP